MANAGDKPDKPVWFGFKKFNLVILTGLIGPIIVVGVYLALRPINSLPLLSTIHLYPSASPQPAINTIHLRAVGDIMMSRSVGLSATKRQNWKWPFEGTTPYLLPVDLTIGNLEFPLTDPCQLQEKVMTFCAPTKAVAGLIYGHINLVSLANNHLQNFGDKGFTDTVATLKQAGIEGVATYETVTLTIKDQVFGFLALDDITHPLDLERVHPLLADLSQRAQVVVVLIHWGNEYEPLPSDRQKTIAKDLVNNGATIILGTHPHVLQPITVAGNSLIAYSLGNFVFDQMWSEATRKSIILDLDLTFTDGKLTHLNHKSIPITIYEYGQPRLDANQ